MSRTTRPPPPGTTSVVPGAAATVRDDRRRPVGLLAICVTAIVFGALGLVSGGFGLLALAFNQRESALWAVVHAGVGGPLLAGGIMSLALRAWGRKLLLGALTAGIVSEAASVYSALAVKRPASPIMAEFIPRITSAQPGDLPRGVDQMISELMAVMGAIAMVFAVVTAIAKIAIEVVGIVYLRTPAVAALFAAPAIAPTPWR